MQKNENYNNSNTCSGLRGRAREAGTARKRTRRTAIRAGTKAGTRAERQQLKETDTKVRTRTATRAEQVGAVPEIGHGKEENQNKSHNKIGTKQNKNGSKNRTSKGPWRETGTARKRTRTTTTSKRKE
jgi:hypothetical protein